MKAIDQPDDAAAGPSGDPNGADAAANQRREDERTISRIESMPRDIGWMMVVVGVLGVALPGIIGTPFLIAGITVLAPGGPKLLSRLAGREPSGFMRVGLRQVGRYLDDLERRYPPYRPRRQDAPSTQPQGVAADVE